MSQELQELQKSWYWHQRQLCTADLGQNSAVVLVHLCPNHLDTRVGSKALSSLPQPVHRS